MFRQFIAAVVLVCSACASARDNSQHQLAIDRPEAETAGVLLVSSPAFIEGGTIPDLYSAWREGISPQLDWSGVPEEAVSLVLLMEDPDAPSARPYLHWAAWNIDPAVTGLPEDIATAGREGLLAAMVEGRNDSRKTGYFGPRPSGSKPHHYHFQLFALDRTIRLDPDATREEILAAMAGHVLARGQLVGLFTKPGKL